jgi:hypothetical protein
MVRPGRAGNHHTVPFFKTLSAHRMNGHPLPKKGFDHSHGETKVGLERERIRFDWLQAFQNHFGALTFQPFDKFFKQHPGLLGERVKNNENPFFFQMTSSYNDIGQLEHRLISFSLLFLLTKKRAPDKSGALFIVKEVCSSRTVS